MKEFSSYLDKQLKDPAFRKEFFRIHYRDDLADQILILRAKRAFSQKKLAELAKTTQAVISRIENGSVNSSLGLIQKIAEALGASIKVEIIPDEEMVFQEFYLNYLYSFEQAHVDTRNEKESESLIGQKFLKVNAMCLGELSAHGNDEWKKTNANEKTMA